MVSPCTSYMIRLTWAAWWNNRFDWFASVLGLLSTWIWPFSLEVLISSEVSLFLLPIRYILDTWVSIHEYIASVEMMGTVIGTCLIYSFCCTESTLILTGLKQLYNNNSNNIFLNTVNIVVNFHNFFQVKEFIMVVFNKYNSLHDYLSRLLFCILFSIFNTKYAFF